MKGFRKGGGFLNNVAGLVTQVEWTTENPGQAKSKKDFTSLFFRIFVKTDGADDTVDTHLFAGDGDAFEIDGTTLKPLEEGYSLGAGTGTATFIESLIEAGFPENLLFNESDEIDFSAIVGGRYQFVQRKNEELTKKLGKRKDKKTGKEYDRVDLVVDRILELPSAKGSKAGKASSKPAGKAGKAAASSDVSEVATAALLRYLEAADGEITKNKIRTKVLTDKEFSKDRELKDAVTKLLIDDDFLSEVEGTEFDAKKGVVTTA